jgi:hypothetical protein
MMDRINEMFLGGLTFRAPAAPAVLEALPSLRAHGVRLVEIDREAVRAAGGEADVAAIEALEYDPMLEKAGVAFRSFKEVMAAYGIDADAALSQVQAEVIAIDGPSAVVRVRYPLLGKEVSFEQPMRQIDGGWYREDAIEALERSVAELGAAPATGTADSAAAPAN